MPLQIVATAAENDRHVDDVETLLFHNGRLFSGGDDGKIKIWSTDLQLLGEFRAHQVSVFHLEADGASLFSCSNDGAIHEWIAPDGDDTWQLRRKLRGHVTTVTRLRMSEGRLYSGDEYGGVGVWNDGTLQCIYCLVEEVWDLHVSGELLYSVRDKDVVITKMMPGASYRYCTKMTMEGRGPMCVVDDKLCFVSRDGMDVYVHRDGKDFSRLSTLQGHDRIIKALCGKDGKLFSSGWDGLVIQWDLASHLPHDRLQLKGCVNVLCQGPNGRIFAAGDEGMLCALDKVD